MRKSSLFKKYDGWTTGNTWLIKRIPEWLQNFEVTRETIGFKKTLHDLPQIADSALVIDNPFTGSMERQAEYLSAYNGTIIACDRALSKLLCYVPFKRESPTYVVNVDSSYLCSSFFDRPDVRMAMPYVTAIFSVCAFPLTIRTWSGDRCFITCWMGDDLTWALSSVSKTDIVMPGGCVHNTAWVIAYVLGAKTIGLYGVDNSYDYLRETEYPDIKHKKVHVEELGRDFYVDPVYETYAERLFKFMSVAERQVKTINCGENGIMYDSVARQTGYSSSRVRIERKTLKQFVEKCQ